MRGELCVDKVINPKLYKKLNHEYPRRMRELGWTIENCTVYDAEKAKSMPKDETAAYKAECRTKRRQKKSGVDSKTYKAQKEIEKLEKDKARLGRDLAIAATQQAKRQTAAVCQQKAALEAVYTGKNFNNGTPRPVIHRTGRQTTKRAATRKCVAYFIT